jgi:hypothetical protein
MDPALSTVVGLCREKGRGRDLLREQTQIRQGSEVLHATWTEILLRSRSQEDEGGSFVFCKKLLG